MRGRLIQRFLVDIRRLDPVATAAVVGGGYNDILGEPVIVDNSTQLGATSRREKTALVVKCQIDRDPKLGVDELTRGGHQESGTLVLILAMKELENRGLLQSNGEPDIHPGDRVASLMDLHGNVIFDYSGSQRMFVQDSEPRGYGLAAFGTPKVNLWALTCRPEEKGEVV